MEIIKKLNTYLNKSNSHKSSFWLNRLDDSRYLNIDNFLGFGTFTKKKYFSNYVHKFFQKKIFGEQIFYTDEYKKYLTLFNKQKRQINIDNIQHVYFFKKIKEYFENIDSACVIGDGKINFLSGMTSIFPNAKIFSINLAEVLIHDYLILKKCKLIDDKEICVLENKEDLLDKKIKLYLITPDNAELLLNGNVDLFVNFSSFQEMNMSDINFYFNIAKTNKSHLYTCNRYYKTLPGGEVLKFEEYPWGSGRKIFYEKCHWISKYYNFRPPFFHNYDGEHWHCLISYK